MRRIPSCLICSGVGLSFDADAGEGGAAEGASGADAAAAAAPAPGAVGAGSEPAGATHVLQCSFHTSR